MLTPGKVALLAALAIAVIATSNVSGFPLNATEPSDGNVSSDATVLLEDDSDDDYVIKQDDDGPYDGETQIAGAPATDDVPESDTPVDVSETVVEVPPESDEDDEPAQLATQNLKNITEILPKSEGALDDDVPEDDTPREVSKPAADESPEEEVEGKPLSLLTQAQKNITETLPMPEEDAEPEEDTPVEQSEMAAKDPLEITEEETVPLAADFKNSTESSSKTEADVEADEQAEPVEDDEIVYQADSEADVADDDEASQQDPNEDTKPDDNQVVEAPEDKQDAPPKSTKHVRRRPVHTPGRKRSKTAEPADEVANDVPETSPNGNLTEPLKETLSNDDSESASSDDEEDEQNVAPAKSESDNEELLNAAVESDAPVEEAPEEVVSKKKRQRVHRHWADRAQRNRNADKTESVVRAVLPASLLPF